MERLSGLFLLAFSAGVTALQQSPVLPESPGVILGFGLASGASAAMIYRRAGYRRVLAWILALAGGLLFGWGWAAFRAEARLADRLDPAWENQDIRLVGQVVSLPVEFQGGQRFVFRVEHLETPEAKVPRRIWLSRYDSIGHSATRDAAPPVRVGERWALTVRLRRPHGTVNPGGFDYESWLLQRGLSAVGSVRMTPSPERLSGFRNTEGVLASPLLGVHALRAQVRESFQRHLRDAPYGGILTALAIGDQQSVPGAQWNVFNRTGTTHLMSISGLHVTLVALLVMLALNRVWRAFPTLCRRISAQQTTLAGGALGAFGYALLAGFGVPARRTCFMVATVALALLLGRRSGSGRVLLLALSGVLLFDPWAGLSPGFWLSFGAIAALLWIGSLMRAEAGEAPKSGGFRLRRRVFRGLLNFGRAQWAATLATLPILIWTFQQFPLVSPLANLIAIPVISFVVTPLALLSALLVWVPEVSPPLLDLAHGVLALLMRVLEFLAAWPLWRPPEPAFHAVVLAAFGVFLLLLPSGFPGRVCGAVLILPILFWPAPHVGMGDLRVTVLDVGQGQAVLLETAEHRLLYDTGPLYGFGPDADDAARRVILPHLARRGIRALDAVVLSHRDRDHSGGFETLRAGIASRQIFSPQPEVFGGETCRRGAAWEWDGAWFEFLYPAPTENQKLSGGNGDSCVLKVTTASGRLLLPGDIDRRGEKFLLDGYADQRERLSAEALLLPHHGSRSSSSPAFVSAVGPKWALVSAGYRNRFRHPHPDVLERYARLGESDFLYRTDQDGALTLDFSRGEIRVTAEREQKRRYWRDSPKAESHSLR